MGKNVWTLIAVSAIFGLGFGIYDLTLPLFLDASRISFKNMGLVFGIAGLTTFFLRIVTGGISDLFQRKILYTLALTGYATASLFAPITVFVPFQVFLKSMADSSWVVRDTMHTVLLYEHAREKFVDFAGKSRGMEFMFTGLGTLLGGYLLLWLSYKSIFLCAGLLLGFALAIFSLFFREKPRSNNQHYREYFRRILAFDMDRQLWIMTAQMFIFSVGIGCSHCFVMPLFFLKKFDMSQNVVGIIMMLHRVLLGLPMLFVGMLKPKYFRITYISMVIYQGLATAIPGIIPGAWLATIIWLSHDLFGAGVYWPIQLDILQRLSREETRATDFSLVLGLASLGQFIGPLIAGHLLSWTAYPAKFTIGLPFLVGGLLNAVSAVLLFWIRFDAPALRRTQCASSSV